MRDFNDMALVREYVRVNSEAAFAELVDRHISLVYSAAFRHAGQAAHAQEITQAVFIILARKAAGLRPDTVLAGWLCETTRLTALSFMRGEHRRQRREQEAYMQSTLRESTDETVWNQLSPLLDEAMSRLGRKERDAVVLRYFKDQNLREVAELLNINEPAAQKRVNRALEKLRKFFTKRGVDSTTATIAGAISANSVQAAPVGLAKTISVVAVAKGAAASISTLTLIKGALKIMAWTKMKSAVVVAVAVLLTAGTTTTLIVTTIYSPEPTYQGKKLSDWTKAFFKRTANGYTISRGGPSADAVKQIGKKAVPTLLKMIGLKKPYDKGFSYDTQMQAAGGFWALGPAAESAIPELTKLLNQPKYATGAAESLAGIDPLAAEPLIQSLNSTNPSVRVLAASALGKGFESHYLDSITYFTPTLGTNAASAVDALIPCTKDSDKIVRAVATSALGNIDQEPEEVIPVLVEQLKDNDPQCRRMAAQAIGFFGKDARLAIPSLTSAMSDSDGNVRRLAKEALERINRGIVAVGK